MNVPYSWLKEILPDAPPVEDLVPILDSLGLAVEAVHELPAAPVGVVVARIESCEAIEGSDHLSACMVTDGEQHYSVVCGAPNARAGLVTALAKVGCQLPGTDFVIGKRKMRGVESEGMLCSPKELALYDYAGGIIVLAEDSPIGTPLAQLWSAETVIELELTPNRADAFSILGVARDLAAKLGVSYRHPADGLDLGDETQDDGLTARVEDSQGCPRFTLRRIDDVTIKPSPIWMQRHLAALGLRPRNNVVDITNYVTFETGHPSHAYDLGNVVDNTIIVRRAKEGETLVTLSEETLELSPDDLAITMPDGQGGRGGVIGLAGVIGGLDDSISSHTHQVALELAHWDPVSIRKTAKRHAQHTDAHFRFERGVDPNLPRLALARACQLMAELADARVHPGVTDTGTDRPLEQVAYRPSRTEFLTTLVVPLEEQQRSLEALGCQVERRAEDDWLITVPSWRVDLAYEEDIIEEVARLYGYDHIAESIPCMHFVPEASDATHSKFKTFLSGMGLTELMSYTFTSENELSRAAAPAAVSTLANPQSAERSVLRTALHPGMLAAAQLNHRVADLALFEVGHVFNDSESERLGLLMRGSWAAGGWLASQPLDFYLFKGLLEKLAATLAVEFSLTPATDIPCLHPGVAARVIWDGQDIGWMGRLHPEVAARYELGEVYLAELAMPLTGKALKFQDYDRQPHAERDLAIVVDKASSYAQLASLVSEAAGEQLETVAPFDLYEGESIPADKRSIALRFTFRDRQRSLTDEEVDGFMANIMTAVRQAGYTLRG